MTVVCGMNLYPSSVDRVVRRFDEVRECRVMISGERDMHEMAVGVGLERGSHADLPDQMAKCLAGSFGVRIPVRTVDAGTLPRFEMKARRWVRENS